jgi:hypothetical protein
VGRTAQGRETNIGEFFSKPKDEQSSLLESSNAKQESVGIDQGKNQAERKA